MLIISPASYLAPATRLPDFGCARRDRRTYSYRREHGHLWPPSCGRGAARLAYAQTRDARSALKSACPLCHTAPCHLSVSPPRGTLSWRRLPAHGACARRGSTTLVAFCHPLMDMFVHTAANRSRWAEETTRYNYWPHGGRTHARPWRWRRQARTLPPPITWKGRETLWPPRRRRPLLPHVWQGGRGR